MRVTFCYPSTHQRTAGVWVIYELANGLARRGHDVRFVHGPAWPDRIDSLDELPTFDFEPEVRHFIVDDTNDPIIPDSDIVFLTEPDPRLGQPISLVQGHKMMADIWEHAAYRVPAPKLHIARWLRQVGIEFGVPAEQMMYLPLGIDHGIFNVAGSLDNRPFDVAVLYNPHPQKGWNAAFRFIHRLAADRPETRVAVFGFVVPPEELPTTATLFTNLDHEGLAETIYNQAKVFVQASRVEGFGYTPVEAMACGAALVTTDNGGSQDYAVADETAVVVPVGDVDAMFNAVVGLLDDEPRRTAMAEAGAQFVKRFDWEETARVLEGHLERYLADPVRFQAPPAELT